MGAALLGMCILRALEDETPTRELAASKAYIASAAEFEHKAIGLLEHTAKSSKKLSSLLLVRRMPKVGLKNTTLLVLATCAEAYKFTASPICQVSADRHDLYIFTYKRLRLTLFRHRISGKRTWKTTSCQSE